MQRPSGVPERAEWNAADAEWELGTRRDDKHVGEWLWWRGDGTKVCHSLFDDDGQLHGVCRRYHPSGDLAYQATFEHGQKAGVEIVCRPITGDTTEVGSSQLAELDDELHRMDMFWAGDAIQATTMYNRDGLLAPAGAPLGEHLHKLLQGTCFTLTSPFLVTMGSAPQPMMAAMMEGRSAGQADFILPPKIPRSMVKAASYICLAVHGGTLHRVDITDHKGRSHIAIIEAESISQSLVLTVDQLASGRNQS